MKNHRISYKFATVFLVLMYPRTSFCVIIYVLYLLLIVSLCSVRLKLNLQSIEIAYQISRYVVFLCKLIMYIHILCKPSLTINNM